VVRRVVKITEDEVDVKAMPPYRLAEVYVGPHERFVIYWYWSLSEQKYKREKVRVGRRAMHQDALMVLLENVKNELNKEFKLRNRKLIYHPEDGGSPRKAAVDAKATLAELALKASQDASLKAECSAATRS
jgi:hypothetical protein